MLGLLGDSKRKIDIDALLLMLRNRINSPKFMPSLLQKKILKSMDEELRRLRERKISNPAKRAELRKLLFQYYLDAYLDERKPNPFNKGIELGNVLRFFEELLKEGGFVKEVYTELHLSDHRNFIPLVVVKEDMVFLTMHAFNRGMREGFTGTRDSKRIFVNAMNAVMRMGENAVSFWNKELATKVISDKKLHLIPKKDAEGKNRHETRLEDLHEHLKRDVQFLQAIRMMEL